jgi:hypothetical protein
MTLWWAYRASVTTRRAENDQRVGTSAHEGGQNVTLNLSLVTRIPSVRTTE